MAFTERILRYCLSGGIVALVFSVAVILAVNVLPRVGPVGASVIAFFVTLPVGYAVHCHVTYPDAAHEQNAAVVRWRRFITANIGSFVVATVGMAFITQVLHASYLWGIALNWICVPTMNFVVYLWWVFRERST